MVYGPSVSGPDNGSDPSFGKTPLSRRDHLVKVSKSAVTSVPIDLACGPGSTVRGRNGIDSTGSNAGPQVIRHFIHRARHGEPTYGAICSDRPLQFERGSYLFIIRLCHLRHARCLRVLTESSGLIHLHRSPSLSTTTRYPWIVQGLLRSVLYILNCP